MYKKMEKSSQPDFWDFNESCGIALNRDDEWIRIADALDWDAVEKEYMDLFKSGRGRPAVSARIALGALIIQKRMGFSDRELVREIARSPYYQYFIGLPRFQAECPFRRGVLSELRKRFGLDILKRINEIFLKRAEPTREHARGKPEEPKANGNHGTMILDATCSPQNIRFPLDYSLLNEARKLSDIMIDDLHKEAGDGRRPRTYRKTLQDDYLSVARAKKPAQKKVHGLIGTLLRSVERNTGFVRRYLSAGFILSPRQERTLATVDTLYAQQKMMYDTQTHRVENRIVSISQPFVRPIVRGKKRAPVEFGAKYDVSIDEFGHARLEKLSFDAYNESTVLISAVERYRERTGHYPCRVLVDQIYRTRANRNYCEERGIEMQGKRPGKPTADKAKQRAEKRRQKKNERDRNEVERFFSVDKRKFGAGLIMTKLEETSLASIALSVLVANLFETNYVSFFCLFIFGCTHLRFLCRPIGFRDVA